VEVIDIKETIYTIPVMEAIDGAGECAICAMRDGLEASAVNFLMGPGVAYMEDDVRMQTNAAGFCRAHYRLLLEGKNRLGIALMLHTHYMQINQEMADLMDAAAGAKRGLFRRNAGGEQMAPKASQLITACYICAMIERNFSKYIETFFEMFGNEDSVREKIAGGAGFCMGHFALIMDEAPRLMSAKSLAKFYEIVIPLQKAQMARMEGELDWFIKKFDYRFADADWKTSKDAIERGISKIAGMKI